MMPYPIPLYIIPAIMRNPMRCAQPFALPFIVAPEVHFQAREIGRNGNFKIPSSNFIINLLHVPGFIHGKEKETHLPFRVSLEALEKPMRKTRQGVRPLRGRIPHVAWLRIKEVSRFPVSQRCAERNMVVRAMVGDFIAGCNSTTFHQCTTQRTRNLTRKVFQGGFHVGTLRSEIARKSNDRLGVWRPWHGRGALLRDRFTVPWRNRG